MCEWLEVAYAQRDIGGVYAAGASLLQRLHGDPRWQPFLHPMGLA